MDEMMWLRDIVPAISFGILACLPFLAFLWVNEVKLKFSMPSERQLAWFRGLFLVAYLIASAAFFDALSDPSVTIGIVGATFLLLVLGTLAFFRPYYHEDSKRLWFSWMLAGMAMLAGTVAFSIGAALQYINQYSTAYGDDVMKVAAAVMAFAGTLIIYRYWDERRKRLRSSETSATPA